MGKEYLIDTNAVIDYLDNKLPAKANAFIDGNRPNISVITRIELLAWSGADERQLQILKEFVDQSDIFNLQEDIILHTINIRKSLKTKLPDAIIAATAIYLDLPLLTFDSDFARLPQLKLFILE